MKQRKPPLRVTSQRRFAGADDRIRTGDLILTKDALYRLSYISTPSSLDARFIILHPASKSKGFLKFFYIFFAEAFQASSGRRRSSFTSGKPST